MRGWLEKERQRVLDDSRIGKQTRKAGPREPFSTQVSVRRAEERTRTWATELVGSD